MPKKPITSRLYVFEVLRVIKERGSATYFEIGTDLSHLTRRSSIHPILMGLRDDASKPLGVEEDNTTGQTKYRYSLTSSGQEMLDTLRKARIHEEWRLSPRAHDVIDVGRGVLWSLAEEPATIATLVERMAITSSEAAAAVQRLRLTQFIVVAPDDGARYRLTDSGREFLNGLQWLLDGLVE